MCITCECMRICHFSEFVRSGTGIVTLHCVLMLFSSMVSLRTSPAKPEEHNSQLVVCPWWPWLGMAFVGPVS